MLANPIKKRVLRPKRRTMITESNDAISTRPPNMQLASLGVISSLSDKLRCRLILASKSTDGSPVSTVNIIRRQLIQFALLCNSFLKKASKYPILIDSFEIQLLIRRQILSACFEHPFELVLQMLCMALIAEVWSPFIRYHFGVSCLRRTLSPRSWRR